MFIFDFIDRVERKYCNAIGIIYISICCFAACWCAVYMRALQEKGFD